MRLTGLAVVSLALVISACGGGGSSPTEPPEPPVPLEGAWSGTVTITSPTSTTCTMSLDLALDQGAYFGNWAAQCPDGTGGNGVVVVTPLLGNQLIVSGLRSTSVFGGCGWGSNAFRESNRLRGDDWSTTQNCPTGPVLRGRMALTKR